jgi:hypothetical protein
MQKGKWMLNLKEINRRNKKFWTYRKELSDEQIANPYIAAIAKALYDKDADEQEWRKLPSYEYFLEKAERLYKRRPGSNRRTDACRRGGLRDRTDPLQRSILLLVKENSFIKLPTLKRRLRSLPQSGLKFEKDSETGCEIIRYTDSRGDSQSWPKSVLTYRLHRARRKVWRSL